MSSIAVTVTDRNAAKLVSCQRPVVSHSGRVMSRIRPIAGGLESRAPGGWLQTRTTVSFADGFAILNLAAAGFGALAVGLPETLAVAELGDVFGGIALRLSWSTLDFLVAVGVACRFLVAGTGPRAILSYFPTASATHYN